MASIRCAHCRETHDSVAKVRACAYRGTAFEKITKVAAGTATATRTAVTRELAVGNVFTAHGTPGQYWQVEKILSTTAPGTGILAESVGKGRGQSQWFHMRELDMIFADLNAAVDHWQSDRTIQAAHRRELAATDPQPARRQSVHGWDHVRELRDQIQVHLVREERGKHVGYFALLTEEGGQDKVKFYRVRTGKRGGKWANHVFVDSQASDDFWPVRDQDTLTAVLEGILADPEAAGLLYATELGRCCRCRRTLTDETSRALGIGPECRKK